MFIRNPVSLSDGHQGPLADNEIILIRLDRLTVSRLRGNGRRLRAVRTDGNTMPIVSYTESMYILMLGRRQ